MRNTKPSKPAASTKPSPREIDARVESFKAAAKSAGVKLTHQRIEIFRELASSETHPDVETIFRGVQQRVPTVSLDTVYRTMWMLHDLGLVSTLGPQGGAVRFDANLAPHHHYMCVRCGLVRDFEHSAIAAPRLPDSVKQFGTIADAHIEVRGICTECLKRAKVKPSR